MIPRLRAGSSWVARGHPLIVGLVLAILGLAFFLQTVHLQTQSLWLDEIITLHEFVAGLYRRVKAQLHF